MPLLIMALLPPNTINVFENTVHSIRDSYKKHPVKAGDCEYDSPTQFVKHKIKLKIYLDFIKLLMLLIIINLLAFTGMI